MKKIIIVYTTVLLLTSVGWYLHSKIPEKTIHATITDKTITLVDKGRECHYVMLKVENHKEDMCINAFDYKNLGIGDTYPITRTAWPLVDLWSGTVLIFLSVGLVFSFIFLPLLLMFEEI